MKQKILCIDDIKTNLFTLMSVIENLADDKYEVITALSASEGLEILLKEKIDLILLDVMMPEIDGYEAARMIKSSKKTRDIPIIFVTANKDNDTIENCYLSGGSDYINKPFNHVELLARMAFHLKLREKELLLKHKEDELFHEANYDALTQIFNRNMFQKLVSEKIQRAQEIKKCFVFVLFDIDFFKKINDKYGHLVGDNVLKEIADLVKRHTRESDIFARWGGEEFTLCFDVTLEKGVEIAESLRNHISTHMFESAGRVTCSFGVTQLQSEDTMDMMIQRADEALYRAKEEGRNRVCQA